MSGKGKRWRRRFIVWIKSKLLSRLHNYPADHWKWPHSYILSFFLIMAVPMAVTRTHVSVRFQFPLRTEQEEGNGRKQEKGQRRGRTNLHPLQPLASPVQGAEESAKQELDFTAILGDVNRNRIKLFSHSSSDWICHHHNFLSAPHWRWVIGGSCRTLFKSLTASLENSPVSGLELMTLWS